MVRLTGHFSKACMLLMETGWHVSSINACSNSTKAERLLTIFSNCLKDNLTLVTALQAITLTWSGLINRVTSQHGDIGIYLTSCFHKFLLLALLLFCQHLEQVGRLQNTEIPRQPTTRDRLDAYDEECLVVYLLSSEC